MYHMIHIFINIHLSAKGMCKLSFKILNTFENLSILTRPCHAIILYTNLEKKYLE